MSIQVIRRRVLISGLVQGVGYRAATVQMAQALRLGGWVRNLADGRVEAVFEGELAAVEQAIAWCHQGPPAARVSRVEAREEPYEGLSLFETRY